MASCADRLFCAGRRPADMTQRTSCLKRLRPLCSTGAGLVIDSPIGTGCGSFQIRLACNLTAKAVRMARRRLNHIAAYRADLGISFRSRAAGNVGRKVELLPALFALMPVAALVMAPIGIQVVGGRDDRILAGDLVLATCVTEKLTAAGADPVFDVSGGTRAAVSRNSANRRQIVGVGRCYDADIAAGVAGRVIFVAINVGLYGVMLRAAVGLAEMGVAARVPIAPCGGIEIVRGKVTVLLITDRANRLLLAGRRTAGVARGGDDLLYPLDFRIAHRTAHHFIIAAVRRTGRVALVFSRRRAVGVPRGRDLRHIGFRVTAGTVPAFTAVFGTGGGLVLSKANSIVMLQFACSDHIFLLLFVKRGVRECCRVCRQLFESAGRSPRRFNGSRDGFCLFMTAIAGAYPLRRAVYSIPCISRFAVAVFEGSQCFRFFIVAHGTGIGLHARLRTGGWSFSRHLVIMGTLYLDAHFDFRRIVIVCVLWREHHGKNLLAGFRDRCTAVLPPEAARHIYVWGDIFILCLAAGEGAAPQRRAFRQVQRGGCRLCRDHRRGLIHRHLGRAALHIDILAVILAGAGDDHIVIMYPGSGHLGPIRILHQPRVFAVRVTLVPGSGDGVIIVGIIVTYRNDIFSIVDGLIH